MLRIALPGGNSRGLLRGIVEHPPPLLRVETGSASSCSRSAECIRDTVGAAMCLHLERQATEREENARAYVISERDAAKKACAIDTKLFTGGQSGSDNGASGVR